MSKVTNNVNIIFMAHTDNKDDDRERNVVYREISYTMCK